MTTEKVGWSLPANDIRGRCSGDPPTARRAGRKLPGALPVGRGRASGIV